MAETVKAQIRDREIALQFVTDRSILSRSIRWFTWSDFSHVDAVTRNGSLLGARPSGGVQVRRRDYAQFTRICRLYIRVSDEEERAFWKFLVLQIDKPYDWRAIFNFWTHRRDPYRGVEWFCSELQAGAIRAMGWRLLDGFLPLNRIVPGLLAALPIYSRIEWISGQPKTQRLTQNAGEKTGNGQSPENF